jgi:hypothetical protein
VVAKEKSNLKQALCENFDSIRLEDILYALEYGGVKLPCGDIIDHGDAINLDDIELA